jgi:hypothetical protein
LQWAVAIGANATATVAGGLFNLALAVGTDSIANTTPQAVGGRSNFDLAAAWFGGNAWASDGNFQLANAVLTGNAPCTPDNCGNATGGYVAGAFAQYGNFNLARAAGKNSLANAGSSTATAIGYGSFNLARALGAGASALAIGGIRGKRSGADSRLRQYRAGGRHQQRRLGVLRQL